MSQPAKAVQVGPDPAPTRTAGNPRLLQRRCACGAGAGVGGECESCAEKRALNLQRKGAGARPAGIPASVAATLAAPGRPLDAPTRSLMEQRFGADFGAVRIHDDSAATRSARDVNAHAYTVGQDVVFDQGQYRPDSASGRHLLAHELAHTLQQQGLQRAGIGSLADQGPDYRRLEGEADRAADRVMAGLPVPSGWFSRGGIRLSRKAATQPAASDQAEQDKPQGFEAKYESKTYNKAVSISTEETPRLQEGTTVSPASASYVVDKLVLPGQKGPYALDFCNKSVGSDHPLKAEFTWGGGKPRPRGNIPRDPTDTLRRSWLSKTDYKLGKEAHQRWRDIGGGKHFPELPVGPTCEIDHLQELQVGGDNKPPNLQVLDKVDNGSSGNLIQQELGYLATLAFDDAKGQLAGQGKHNRRPKSVRLDFSRAVMQGSPQCNLCCQLARRFIDPGVTAESAKASGPVLVDFEIIVLGNSHTLKLPGDKSRSIPLAESAIAENKAVANLIKGLKLLSFERGGKGHDRIRAAFDADMFKLKPNTKGGDLLLPIGPDGALKLPSGKLAAPVHFEYQKLSAGEFRSLQLEGNKIGAEGIIRPGLPFLPTLDVAIANDSFRVFKGLDKDKLKSPFGGFRFTKAELALELAPAFKPVGTIEFEVGAAAKPVARGNLTATADDAGFLLTGVLYIYLPGVDQAKGEIRYQGGAWSGGAHIEASQIKLPYIKSGAVDIHLQAHRLDAAGKVVLALPGGNEADLQLQYRHAKWLFTGHGRIRVKSPYLKPIEAWIAYDGELLYAKGKAGFAFAGLDGTVEATYEHKNGHERVYGKGDLKIDKGRAQGNIAVELHPNEKITGTGRLSYEIKKGLVATAGITVDEQQKITFDGELSFPDIKLFDRFPRSQDKHTLFEASGSIPIPGASIGPIGLEVQLWGGLYYYYYVGPGVLKEIRARVQFSPFEDNPDFSFSMHAKASIPAGGGITGKIGADVVLSAYVAKVGGGLSVFATAGLEGEASLTGDIAYAKDRFSVDASAYIGGRVILEAGLDARVFAEAGVWRFKVRTEKDWNLAKTDFNTGLQLGVRVPLHYDSVEGFRMPSLASIKPEPEQLDLNPSHMLSSLFGRARSEEHEA